MKHLPERRPLRGSGEAETQRGRSQGNSPKSNRNLGTVDSGSPTSQWEGAKKSALASRWVRA
jgi:hypothetical protein